jgi:hypothetical protein
MRLIKEIKSKSGKLHFRRWEILKTPWFSIWIHGIYAPDEDKHLHNHPWDFKSIVLKGNYIEETENGYIIQHPGKYNSRNGEDFHKIKQLISESVYTLFISTPVKRDWGYKVDGAFIKHDEYRKLKNESKLI